LIDSFGLLPIAYDGIDTNVALFEQVLPGGRKEAEAMPNWADILLVKQQQMEN
jgi:hypothetical protein